MHFASRTNWELRPNRFAQALEEHRRRGLELLDLTASNPPETGLTYDTEAILSVFRNSRILEYRPEPKGLLSARTAVADYYRERAVRVFGDSSQLSIDPDNLVLTTSTSEAYTYAFRLLCEPHDEVLIPTPSYPLFEYLAGLQDVSLVPYHLFYDHGWHIDMHSLQQKITERARAIILVNPNNPTGSYVHANETAELNVICREHDLALIVDEVFLDYSLGEAQQSFALNREALTFTMSGLSKISGLPQMKFSWIATSGPDDHARAALARLEVIADTYLSMNAPVQLAAPTLLAQRHLIQEELSTRLRSNLDKLDQQLRGGMVSRLAIEGGWYAVLRVPRVRSDEELAISLLRETKVLVQPGYFYDFPGEGHIVLSLITPEEVFRCGVERLIAFVHRPQS